MESLSSLLPIIQLAITPVILISGMGALMITLTNRMARIVDRTRELAELIPEADPDERQHLENQLAIMWRRTLMIRRAVTSNGLSMLVSCLLIVVLFAAAMFDWNLRVVVLVLFAASILLLTASLVDFLRDIFVSLHALQLQVARARQKPATRAPWAMGGKRDS
jgi:type IV secretory pathway VirB6-like protein